MTSLFTDLTGRPEVMVPALAGSVVLLVWIARRVRRIAGSERPDKVLSRVAMLVGLGWSSEAVWELTGRIPQFPAHMRLLVFFVLEVILVLSMIRADANKRDFGTPGRAGSTAWIVATVMAAVAASVSHTLPEALLRAAIPLLLTLQWWDGLVGDRAGRPRSATSWRWTPRRALLWLGAIEPGERDVETVHRERLTQQMTRLEFRRRHGSARQQRRAAGRLARLGLTADDAIVTQVRDRVDRAMWFVAPAEVKQPDERTADPVAGLDEAEAASRRARRVLHRRSLRTLRVVHPAEPASPVQVPEPDPRTKQEIDDAIRFIKTGCPDLTQRQIAAMVRTTGARVHRALRSSRTAADETPAEQINGAVPVLAQPVGEGA